MWQSVAVYVHPEKACWRILRYVQVFVYKVAFHELSHSKDMCDVFLISFVDAMF